MSRDRLGSASPRRRRRTQKTAATTITNVSRPTKVRSKGRRPKSTWGATRTSAHPATTSSVARGSPWETPPLNTSELAMTSTAHSGKMWPCPVNELANSTAATSPITLASASRETVML
ncbi:MAG: hypothetical protein QM747_02290 [Nocardioides sp.]